MVLTGIHTPVRDVGSFGYQIDPIHLGPVVEPNETWEIFQVAVHTWRDRIQLGSKSGRQIRVTEDGWLHYVQSKFRLQFRWFSSQEKHAGSKHSEADKRGTEPDLSARNRNDAKPECSDNNEHVENITAHRSPVYEGDCRARLVRP